MTRNGFRLAVVAMTPLLVAAVAVRPADAAKGYDGFALSALAAGVRTAGDVGASGGLVTLDTGSAQVSARLDSSPSSGVLAAPYEPGTLVRTVVGQVNAGAGEQVLDVPDAEAQSPGDEKEARLDGVPPQTAGPLSLGGGAATAQASPTSARGSATGAALTADGAFEVGASTTQVELRADAAAGRATATARTEVSRVLVAGVLELSGVVGTATVTADGDRHKSTASLVVGGASVAGQPVTIGDEGVTVAGTPVVEGQSVAEATAQANAVLSAAGITVGTLAVTRTANARGASADTGGVTISVATPDLPGGVAGNRLQLVVGGVSLTEVDEPALVVDPSIAPVDVPTTPPGGTTTTSGGTTTFVPGAPAPVALPDAAAPPVAAAPPAAAPAPATVLLAGRSVDARTALAGFAAWQFLSLGSVGLFAFASRRRPEAEADA